MKRSPHISTGSIYHTAYRTMKGVKYSMRYVVEQIDPLKDFEIEKLSLTFSKRVVLQRNNMSYFDPFDLKKEHPSIAWRPGWCVYPNGTTYDAFQWEPIWYERYSFEQRGEASLLYLKFLSKDLDELIMMAML